MNTKTITVVAANIFTPSYARIVTIGVLLAVTIVMYLFMINSTTELGAHLGALEDEYSQVAELNKDLQLTAAQYQSIAHLQERLEDLPLAEVQEVGYVIVSTPGAAVAKR